MKISRQKLAAGSWQVKFLISFIMCMLLATSYQLPVSAQEASGSVKAASTSSTLQEKIQVLKDEIASKAAKLKLEVNKQLSNRMVAGQIIDSNPSKISVTTITQNDRGETNTQTILVNEYTTFLDTLKKTKSKTIEQTDLKASEYIIGLGDIDDQGNLVAKKVLVTEKPEFSKTITWGTISEVKEASINIKTKDHQTGDFVIDKKTDIMNGQNPGTISDLLVNKMVTISSIANKDSGNTASFIYIIPQGTALKIEKKDSSSTPVATKGATKNNHR